MRRFAYAHPSLVRSTGALLTSMNMVEESLTMSCTREPASPGALLQGDQSLPRLVDCERQSGVTAKRSVAEVGSVACERERQHVVILVRNQGLPPLG